MTNLFSELGLPETLVKGLERAGFTTPTPIQQKAIKPQLEGRDILGIAQTGSGKTAAFSLPIVAGLAALGNERPAPRTARALILAPTRELAVQIEEAIRSFSAGMRVSTVLVLGGVSRYHQVQKIAKGVDVCIATPGRLKDLMDDGKIRLDQTRWLVLDEADRMLDMGFIKPVTEIAAAIGKRRQTALFSATMAPEVAKLAAGLLDNPVRVEAAPPATTVVAIEQSVIFTQMAAKRAKLNELLRDEALAKVIVFARTKHGADRVAKNLDLDGHAVAAIHGNKSQNARQAALKGFASGKVRVLVATDIAARGIDVPGITHVINFELPDDAENYVHRIGRTGRNGATGIAITLCDGAERGKLRDVERLIRRTLPTIGEAGPEPRQASTPAPRRNENKHFSGKRKAAMGEGRPARGGSSAPAARSAAPGDAPAAWWEKPAGNAAAGKPKQRWNKSQKDAGRARRAKADARPPREARAS
ncbi:DEAD/DEAH box helicase [Arsenicitalea aurantiaca]|uniref:DEAD/DEAH box helicase n=1 Tax=Arsenicitalea aurantiaca TaxID=1783274 RepID=A0A433XLG2_9HYPH|nr:DEAD/DEAH box helicase [Arsenicitalea aurantiaca]RUT34915.1 DEAD/DEAH box helicase [Arsenicitalea aurantiaca]